MLRLAGVSRAFASGTAALDGVDLDVAAGELVALVGASGCGKTTLLRLIAGLDAPSNGALTWAEGAPPRRAYVFQAPTLLPWASVESNVRLPLDLAGQSGDVRAALTAVGLEGKASAKPHQLSGGQQMRVSLARALVSDPALLLLDEPFAALDELTRQRLADLVAALKQERGLTILFVTHNISEAVFLADRVLLMAGPPGRIAADLRIKGPAQRDAAFRADPAYHAQCAALSAQLAQVAA
jgi:NitT/TauT family transport system ATP-binding protein